MSPTVTRSELNNADDIIAEPRLVPIRARKSAGAGSVQDACRGKSGFQNKFLADHAAQRVAGRHSYRCPYCRLWHVGNRNKG